MRQKIIRTTVRAGERIPFDGIIVEGFAMVDESAQTGVSTPAMLAANSNRNTAIAGTLVLEGCLTIESAAREKQSPDSMKAAVAVLLAVAIIMLVSLFAYFTSCKDQPPKADCAPSIAHLTKSESYLA